MDKTFWQTVYNSLSLCIDEEEEDEYGYTGDKESVYLIQSVPTV